VLKKLDDLNKSSDSLNFQIPEVDLQDVNSSEEKIDKNKQWIKFRKNDIYIEQTMKSLDKIILQNSMVKSKD
jgi:hypothetical protein